MFTALLSFFGINLTEGLTKTALSWLAKLLPVFIGAVMIIGVYAYGHHQATVACKEAQVSAQLKVANNKLDELEKQYKAAQEVIARLQNKEQQVQEVTRTVIKKIPIYVHDKKGCEVGKDVIDLLNSARGR